MEEGGRSGSVPARFDVDRRRVPSGCLIVKKKVDGVMGSGGCPSGKLKIFETKKEKRRLILSDSESSDEEELMGSSSRGNVRGTDSSMVNRTSVDCLKHIQDSGNFRQRMKSESGKCMEGNVVVRRNGFFDAESGKKRGRIGYGEDGGSGKRKSKKQKYDDEVTDSERSSFLKPRVRKREFEAEFRKKPTVDKGMDSNFGRERSLLAERDRSSDVRSMKRIGTGEDRTFRPAAALTEKYGVPSCEPIRLQGRNGVLKVMRKNVNAAGGCDKSYTYSHSETRKGSENAVTSSWKERLQSPSHSGTNFYGRSRSDAEPEKNKASSQKVLSISNNEVCSRRAETINIPMLHGSENVGSCSSKKEVRSKKEGVTTSKGVGRGSGTEKQLIREQIKKMLVTAGWTIDLRPRKTREYQDAVYTSPAGTEYWSILKAYYALQKECEGDNGEHGRLQSSSSFVWIPEEDISKLTRQARKKVEKDFTTKHDAISGNKTLKEATGKISKKEHVRERPEGMLNGKKLSSSMQKVKTVKERMNGDIGLSMKGCKSRKHPEASQKDGYANEEGNLTDSVHKAMPKPSVNQYRSFASDAHFSPGRKNKMQHGRGLLARSFNQGMNTDDEDDYIPYPGKRTVLSWLIDSGVVSLSGKVRYMNKKRSRAMLKGWITRDGIHCSCCSKILTVSKFEIHAGSKLRQAFQNIFVESGESLFQCQLNAWKKQQESDRSGFYMVDCNSDDPNDDTCSICGDGGDLICCDGCPSTFHQSCLGVQMLPSGDWHCPNCLCRFCGVVGGTTVQGEDAAISALLTCSLCEEKYHISCCRETDTKLVDPNNSDISFCGIKCRELYEKLQKLLGVKHELEAGFSWSLIKRSDLDRTTCELPQKAESNSKIAVALEIMDECFLPIVDRRSGIKMIHNVLYNCGSNFSRLNYSGFHTVVLERGDEIISAATIRIRGTRLAEMPFIGTRHIYRRQGMCRRLLSAIESVLSSLSVERLIIPAISDLIHTWTSVFGFKPLQESQKQELRSMNMLVFPGTGLLQKLLLKHSSTKGNVNDNSDLETIDLRNNHQKLFKVTNKSDIGSTTEPDVHASATDVISHALVETNNTDVSGVQAPALSFHNSQEESGPNTQLDSGVNRYNELEVEKRPGSCSPVKSELQLSSEGTVSDCYALTNGVQAPALSFHNLQEESGPNTQFIESGVNHYSEIEVEKRPRSCSPVKPELQFSSEGTVSDCYALTNGVQAPALSFHNLQEESGPNSQFIDSGVNRYNELEVEKRPRSCSPVKSELQFSSEGTVSDCHALTNEITGIEPDLRSVVESSVQHMSNTPDAVTSYNSQTTDGYSLKSCADVNHYMHDVKSNSDNSYCLLSGATQYDGNSPCASGEVTRDAASECLVRDALELNTGDVFVLRNEIVDVQCDPYTSKDSPVHRSSDINTELQDIDFVESFQVRNSDTVCHDSVGTSKSVVTVSGCNFQGLMEV